MPTPYTTIEGRDEILAGYGDDPFLSCFIAEQARALVTRDALVWSHQYRERRTVMGDGDPQALAKLALHAMAEFQPQRLTMPSAAFAQLPETVKPTEVGRWVWFYIRNEPGKHPGEDQCEWFSPSDYDEVSELLDVAFPHASARPKHNDGDREWFGARNFSGKIIACGAAATRHNGGPMLGSVAVHPQWRRQGLGSAATAWVTRELLHSGHQQVSLGSYVGEDATHRLYRRLGYRDTHELVSGNL